MLIDSSKPVVLNVVLLSIFMLDVAMLSVVSSDCRCAKRRYAECHSVL